MAGRQMARIQAQRAKRARKSRQNPTGRKLDDQGRAIVSLRLPLDLLERIDRRVKGGDRSAYLVRILQREFR
ncbi:hypothetical protein FEK30_00125 (plasmid) [Picosynechococcus sp. PCC 11901]|uniref:hypothetical protein n=1 Tax=Picosynechococcus sp. PCC 11901 TaxID=2579791 RepID=UPI0010FBD72E|nr:hypothetical protein [Picosynechococcus sp. PCC 11901]QCS47978.1 hypothetical protein FEK30_00125 [Picosynechococcus sp. PCC 11901]